MALWSRNRLSLLVDGWMRENLLINKDSNYEDKLTMIIIQFSLIKDHFEHCNPEVIEMSEDKTTIKVNEQIDTECDWATVYGAIQIPSTNKNRHCWTFKIKKYMGLGMTIGIDEPKYMKTDLKYNYAFFNKHDAKIKFYGADDRGDGCAWNNVNYRTLKSNNPTFQTDDIIAMILDLNTQQILMKKNEEETKVIFENIYIGEDVKYCMAVTMADPDDEIELIDHICD